MKFFKNKLQDQKLINFLFLIFHICTQHIFKVSYQIRKKEKDEENGGLGMKSGKKQLEKKTSGPLSIERSLHTPIPINENLKNHGV